MKSVVTYGPKELSLEDRELPTIGPYDLLAEVKTSGICGSDVAIHRGPFPGRLSLPRVLGHEWSGIVIAVGEHVDDFQIGDRIVSEEIFWCGQCRNCRMGAFDFCENAPELGFTVDGAHSTHLRVPSRYCHKLPNDLSFDVGALVEPLSVAYNGVYLSGKGIAPGEKVVVIGLGPIGLSSALWARSSGALVFGIEISHYRAEIARRFGFNVIESDIREGRTSLPPELMNGIDMLIEASGVHEVLSYLLPSMSIHGRVVVLGHSGHDVSFAIESVVLRGVKVVGNCGQVGHNTYERVLKALQLGVVDPTPMISHKVKLSEANSIFRFALDSDNYCKIQFDTE